MQQSVSVKRQRTESSRIRTTTSFLLGASRNAAPPRPRIGDLVLLALRQEPIRNRILDAATGDGTISARAMRCAGLLALVRVAGFSAVPRDVHAVISEFSHLFGQRIGRSAFVQLANAAAVMRNTAVLTSVVSSCAGSSAASDLAELSQSLFLQDALIGWAERPGDPGSGIALSALAFVSRNHSCRLACESNKPEHFFVCACKIFSFVKLLRHRRGQNEARQQFVDQEIGLFLFQKHAQVMLESYFSQPSRFPYGMLEDLRALHAAPTLPPDVREAVLRLLRPTVNAT